MKAVTAEQIFNLALLNERENWGLVVEGRTNLSADWASELLPTEDKLDEFTGALYKYLPGEGWRRRINNNNAVLTLAIACAQVKKGKTLGSANLLARTKTAVVALENPSRGSELVDIKKLPSALRLEQAGVIAIKRQLEVERVSPARIARRARAAVAVVGVVLGLAGLALYSAAHSGVSGLELGKLRIEQRPVLRLAGPGGGKPTVRAAIGPGGSVLTTLV